MKEVGWCEMDICVICGVYVPEGLQVCPYCNQRIRSTTRQTTTKKHSLPPIPKQKRHKFSLDAPDKSLRRFLK